jgi:hypothetical protein
VPVVFEVTVQAGLHTAAAVQREKSTFYIPR